MSCFFSEKYLFIFQFALCDCTQAINFVVSLLKLEPKVSNFASILSFTKDTFITAATGSGLTLFAHFRKGQAEVIAYYPLQGEQVISSIKGIMTQDIKDNLEDKENLVFYYTEKRGFVL